MTEPDNFILKLLREIHEEVKDGFENNGQRLDKIEAKIESLKQAMHGESVLGRYATAEFEDRIEAIEKRLEKLEKGH